MIIGGSDWKLYYHDVKKYTVADLWRTFSICGQSDVKVVGPPHTKAHGEPWYRLEFVKFMVPGPAWGPQQGLEL